MAGVTSTGEENMTPAWTWQRTGEDEWEFGEMVRGMIRAPVGEMYFDEDLSGREGGWVWFTRGVSPENPRGVAHTRQEAARRVEEALGL